MNKKGFTLVELMVVIVIIGILAAVAAPKLSDNINSARCSEVSKRFSKIMDKIVEKEAKGTLWTDLVYVDSDAIETALGVDVTSAYWTYSTVEHADGIQMIATNKKKIGGMDIGAAIVRVTNEKNIEYSHADLKDKYMTAYLGDDATLVP